MNIGYYVLSTMNYLDGNLKQFTELDYKCKRDCKVYLPTSELFPDWLKRPITESDWLVFPSIVFQNSLP